MASERKLTVVLAGDSKGLESALSSAGTESDKFGTKMGGLGTKAKLALVGAGAAVLDFAKDSIAAYTDAEASQETLQAAFSKFPQLAGQNTKALQDLNEQLQAKTIFDHNAAASSEAVLAQFGLTNTQMQQAIPLIEDYAARTGKSLPDAATIFGKAMLGQGKALKGVGINFKDTKSEAGNFDEVMQGLSTHVGGFAEKEGKTTAGQLKILGNQFKDLQVNVGQLLLPALLKLATVGLGIVKFFKDLPGPVKDFLVVIAAVGVSIVAVNKGMALWKSATEAWSAVTKIATGVQMAFNVVMDANPIALVVLAIAALAAGLVLAYEKVGWFHDAVDATFSFVKQIVGDVVGFVTEHWQLLLAILIGPFAVAALLISQHFDEIVGFVTALPGRIVGVLSTLWDGLTGGITTAAQWVGDRIGDVVGFVTSIPGRIAGAASSAFNSLRDAATSVKSWIGDRVGDIVSFFSGLPGKIKSVFAGLGDLIEAPFKAAFGAVKSLWNSTVGGFGFSVPDWVPGIGGKGFHIPKMHTGGIVPGGFLSEPIVMLQGGEGVFTPEQMAALAPSSNMQQMIENAMNKLRAAAVQDRNAVVSMLAAGRSAVSTPQAMVVQIDLTGATVTQGVENLVTLLRKELEQIQFRNAS